MKREKKLTVSSSALSKERVEGREKERRGPGPLNLLQLGLDPEGATLPRSLQDCPDTGLSSLGAPLPAYHPQSATQVDGKGAYKSAQLHQSMLSLFSV